MTRKFKAGDWVSIKGNATTQKMEVLKYIPKKEPIFGFLDSDTYVECVWYRDGERKSQIFHQNRLFKLQETGGMYKT